MMAVLLLFALACDMPSDGSRPGMREAGQWNPLRPPPGSPPGMVCWVWYISASSSQAFGGPICWVEEGERPSAEE